MHRKEDCSDALRYQDYATGRDCNKKHWGDMDMHLIIKRAVHFKQLLRLLQLPSLRYSAKQLICNKACIEIEAIQYNELAQLLLWIHIKFAIFGPWENRNH